MPDAQAGPTPDFEAPSAVDADGGVSVLIVDDNPGKILALETAIAPLGVRIVTAASGREALRQMLDHEFATVVLDVNMPGMDGFETAQLVRGRPRSAHTPIIFVSAVNLADVDVLRGYSLGAVDYILAPVIPEILRAKVSVFVELQRKTEEVRRHAQQLELRTHELQDSQNQLRLAERMAALGTLCAGLGHDMGNLLLPIQARIESLVEEPMTAEVRDALDGIGTCLRYLRKLSGGLRMLSMDTAEGESSTELTDLALWWPDAEPMFRNVLPPGVRLGYTAEPGLPRVRLARHLLTQIVFNLVQNASDALRAAGRGSVQISAVRLPDGVGITVADDGPGMAAHVRERCLEPFFTTKPRGISTGLGLALIHSIVQRIDGRLEIDSTPGQGARFTCTLPASDEAAPAEPTIAVVQVGELRKRSLIASLLSMRGVSVRAQEELETASLWITDDLDGGALRWRAFVEGKPGRRVVVVGAPSERGETGVLVVPENASPAQLRKALWG